MKMLRVKKGIVQIGNSKGIIIPNDFMETLNLKDNSEIYLTIKNGRLIIENADVDFKRANELIKEKSEGE